MLLPFGLVAATTADGFLVLIDASCSNKSKITTQKSVDLHSINEKHRNSSRNEIQGTDQISPENNMNDQITSEKDILMWVVSWTSRLCTFIHQSWS